ncbi:hypothetical protein STRAU_7331 [Streptomyces aurantiacus JA 4570]|uniref:Uncharacterized protein n=1 Tax=Streptomyces aurantiacus JA 4570 TaxID=1286094 RepID=S3Z7E6_9ACTN|nr:hypothetical protein STRAU_7331 [Streptomyces aurantiacus JA 4570]
MGRPAPRSTQPPAEEQLFGRRRGAGPPLPGRWGLGTRCQSSSRTTGVGGRSGCWGDPVDPVEKTGVWVHDGRKFRTDV